MTAHTCCELLFSANTFIQTQRQQHRLRDGRLHWETGAGTSSQFSLEHVRLGGKDWKSRTACSSMEGGGFIFSPCAQFFSALSSKRLQRHCHAVFMGGIGDGGQVGINMEWVFLWSRNSLGVKPPQLSTPVASVHSHLLIVLN